MSKGTTEMGKGRRPPERKVTIADVARAAGVSKTLVSFVLNGRADVGEVTRQRIQTVIAELGYRPNRQARLLVQKKVGVVGLLLEIRAYTDLLVLHFVSALGERLADFGYGLLLLRSGKQNPLEIIASAVEEHKVDGLILMDVLRQDPRVEWLEEAGFPYMLFSSTDQVQDHYVDVDYLPAARLVADHLVERGHQRVGLIAGPAEYQYIHRREESFRRAAEERGLELPEGHCFRGDLTEASGWESGVRLAALPQRPTALFAVTDAMALGAMRGLMDRGVQVPRDLAVIGFGDSPAASGVRPALTTVHMPIQEMGRAAAAGIIVRIDGGEGGGVYIAKPRLVVRDSG